MTMTGVSRTDKQGIIPRKNNPIVRNPTTPDGEHTLQLHPVTERILVCAALRFLIRERKTLILDSGCRSSSAAVTEGSA